MAQKYVYSRHFKIDNPPDAYTHIVMDVVYREWAYYKPILIDATHKEAFYKLKTSTDRDNFIKSMNKQIQTWKTGWYSGFSLHVYPIKKSVPEYGTMYFDPNARYYYWSTNANILPLGETDESKSVELAETFIDREMWLFLAPAPRFQITLMRQIESQLTDVIKSQFGVLSNSHAHIFGRYDIDVSSYDEYISPA